MTVLKKFVFIALMAIALVATAEDRFYIEDFSIEAGESKEIAMILENDSALTAFQTDIYLPEGLSIYQEDGEYIFDVSSRTSYRKHTVTADTLPDGNGVIRLMCYSNNLNTFSGNSGDLIYFTVIASDDFSGTHKIELKNTLFSDIDSNPYEMPNSETVVTGPIVDVLVAGITLDQTELSLYEEDSAQLTAIVTPETATNKNVTWSSSDETVATVDSTGLVTAISEGNATITVMAADASGISASCEVVVAAKPILNEDVVLVIKDTESGQISLVVSPNTTETLIFEPASEWVVSSITFNGEDVTEQLDQDGKFTTPEILSNSTLVVTYELKGSGVEYLSASPQNEVKVLGKDGAIRILGTNMGDDIVICDSKGVILHKEESSGDIVNICIQPNTICVVKINDSVYKLKI